MNHVVVVLHPQDERRRLLAAGNELERVLQTRPVVAAENAVKIPLAEAANFASEAVEVELVGNPPENHARPDQQQSGDQPGEQGDFQAKGVQVHAGLFSSGIR